MSRETGRLYTCDVCGKTEFTKYNAYKSFLTGSPTGDFEDPQERWMFVPGLGDLCESCYSKYKAILEDFKESFRERIENNG